MQVGAVDWVATDIRRILAPNPSAMTGPGTNTYILGRGAGVVVVDPGPVQDTHLAAVLSALDRAEHIAAIMVTHAHKDHSAAAPRLSDLTQAPILAFGCAQSGRSPLMQRLVSAGLTGGGEGVDTTFRPHHLVADGDEVPCGDKTLRIIHTPGHMGGHICLGFGDVLLSGDHAMGWASSLISPPDGDMRAYMASLDRLMAERWSLMLPGHGAAVPDVAARLSALASHRRQREAELLAALVIGPADTADLTRRLYRDTAPALLPAAQRNVLAHLIDLVERNDVQCDGLPGVDTIFTRTESR